FQSQLLIHVLRSPLLVPHILSLLMAVTTGPGRSINLGRLQIMRLKLRSPEIPSLFVVASTDSKHRCALATPDGPMHGSLFPGIRVRRQFWTPNKYRCRPSSKAD